MSRISDVKVQYRVTWFPPDVPQRQRTVGHKRQVRGLLRSEDDGGNVVGEWNPMIEELVTTIEVTDLTLEDIK